MVLLDWGFDGDLVKEYLTVVVANRLYWDVVFISDKFVIEAFLVGFEGVSDYFKKCRFHGLCILLDFVVDDRLDDKLKDLANGDDS